MNKRLQKPKSQSMKCLPQNSRLPIKASTIVSSNEVDYDIIYYKFAKIFHKTKCDQELFAYLKSISLPINSSCQRDISSSSWSCLQCHCNLCLDCYENSKERHKNHQIVYSALPSNLIYGCDCGSSNTLSCSKHKGGDCGSNKEIDEYLLKAFSQEQSKSIIGVLTKLFIEIHKLIINGIGNGQVKKFMSFLGNISQTNCALMHIVAELLIQKYSWPTMHQCVKISIDDIEVEENNDSDQKEHQCSCTFIQLLFREIDTLPEELFYVLLHNYKAKTMMGLAYFALKPSSSSRGVLQAITPKIITDEVSRCVLLSKTFMKYYIGEIKDFVMKSLKSKEYAIVKGYLKDLLRNVQMMMINKENHALMMEHVGFYEGVIDIIGAMHHSIKIHEVIEEINDKDTLVSLSSFNSNPIIIEVLLLELFSLLLSVIDFNNIDFPKKIYDYLLMKISTKEPLNEDEYSFHITLHRALAIFINRFTITYATIKNSDIATAMKELMSIAKIDFAPMIETVYKAIGFALSTKANYWLSYGESMLEYHLSYYDHPMLYQSDFTMIKLLCSLKIYSKYLTMTSLFKYCNIKDSYDNLGTLLLKPNAKPKTYQWLTNPKSRDLHLGHQLLDILLYITRSNHYLLNLFFYPYERLFPHTTTEAPYQSDFNAKEHNQLIKLLESDIANILICNGNNCPYSTIQSQVKASLSFISTAITEETMLEIIDGLLEKNSSSSNGKVVSFALKEKCYDKVDLSFVFDKEKLAQGQRYIIDFMPSRSCKVDLLQTARLPMVNMMISTQDPFDKGVFSKENRKWVMLFTIEQLSNRKWRNVLRHYFTWSLKMILVINSLNAFDMKDNEEEEIMVRMMKMMICSDGEVDGIQRGLCRYCYEQLKVTNGRLAISVGEMVSKGINDERIKEKETMSKKRKEEIVLKYKKEFKERINQFNEGLGNNEEDSQCKEISIGKNAYQCVICRMMIDKDLNEHYSFGRLGVIVKDYFIRNIYHKEIKQLFKDNPDASSLSFFNDNKNIRIITCNHYIHYACYIDFLSQTKVTNRTHTKAIQCPFCKAFSNTFIPFITPIPHNGIPFQHFLRDSYEYKQQETSIPKAVQAFLQDMAPAENNDIEKAYQAHLEYFNGFFGFYENYSNDQIDLLKTVIGALRLVIKGNEIKGTFYYKKFKEVLKGVILGKCSFDTFNEVLFLYVAICDHDKNSMKDLVHVFMMMLPMISMEIFLYELVKENKYKGSFAYGKKTSLMGDFNAFAESNIAKELLCPFLYKLIICRGIILGNDNNTINPTHSIIITKDALKRYEFYLNKLELSQYKKSSFLSLLSHQFPSYWPELPNSKEIINKHLISLNNNNPSKGKSKSNKLKPLINPRLLTIELPSKFSFIPLYPNIVDLVSYCNSLLCSYCNRSSKHSLLCLICNKKLCGEKHCMSQKSIDSLPDYISYINHAEVCGGSTTAYLSSSNGEILFISKTHIFKPKIFLYLNKYGEKPLKSSLSKEYSLNQFEVDKAVKSFVDYSFYQLRQDNDYNVFED